MVLDVAVPGARRKKLRRRLAASQRFLVPVGRVLFALIFMLSAMGHFSSATIAYAASKGVPFAGVLVPFSGVLSFAGGLSVALGYRTRLGAWLLVLFLVPVTLMMHPYWTIEDAAAARIDRILFLKNLSMLGAALMLAHFGGGPYSLDAARQGPAQPLRRAP